MQQATGWHAVGTGSRASHFLRSALLWTLVAAFLFINSCGGGGGSNGTGGGGGGGGPLAPIISMLSPSRLMILAAGGFTLTVFGSNFTLNSVVTIDGKAISTFFQTSTELQANVSDELPAVGTYSVSVRDPAGNSNSLSIVVYSPAQGPEPFLALPGFLIGNQEAPGTIAIGDIDGDGLDDVVVNGPLAGINKPTVAVLRGKADGTLAPPEYVTGAAAMALAVGDVSGDGAADIVAALSLGVIQGVPTNSFTVLLNDGKGHFTAGAAQTFKGSFPGPMALVDFKGAGKKDLVIASQANVLYLFPNQGGGSFGAPATIATLGPDQSFVVADFNGDGKPDIACSGLDSSTGSENTHLLLNQGGGTFSDVVPTALASVGGRIVTGDFNIDSRPDLAFESTDQTGSLILRVSLNLGNGVFGAASQFTLAAPGHNLFSFVVGDFDHDGFPDIAGMGVGREQPTSVLFLWGDGTGNFMFQTVAGPSGFVAGTGDINGDGIPDVVIPDANMAATVVLGRTDRNFPQPTSLYAQAMSTISIGDVDGDGLPDILFGGAIVGLIQVPSSIFLNTGNGNFTLAGRPAFNGVKLADLNGDGKAELLGLQGNTLLIWPGRGDPNYSSAFFSIQPPPGVGLAGFRVADLDGDGLPDLIGDNMIAWNLGNLQFSFVQMVFNGAFAIGDFNRDGKLDVLTGSGTFLTQGNRQFTQLVNNGLSIHSGQLVVAGDFNGDGILDLAIAIPFASNRIVVAYGHGDGKFDIQSMIAGTDNTNGSGSVAAMVAGDFDGDGRADILVPIANTPHVLLYTSDGKGEFQTSFIATGTNPLAVFRADFNADGKPDVIIRNFPTAFAPSNAVIIFRK